MSSHSQDYVPGFNVLGRSTLPGGHLAFFLRWHFVADFSYSVLRYIGVPFAVRLWVNVGEQPVFSNEVKRTITSIRADLLVTTIDSLYEEKGSVNSGDGLDRIPALRACHIFQALAEDEDQSSGPFCSASLNCLYRLMAEIYRVEGPEWRAGGVRASQDAPQSSFVTREAVRSILVLNEMLLNIVKLVREIGEANGWYAAAKDSPVAWQKYNNEVRRRSFKISLQAQWPHLLNRSMEISERDDWASRASSEVSDQLGRHLRAFRTSIGRFHLPKGGVVTTAVHDRVTTLVGEIYKELDVSPNELKTLGSAMEKAAARVVRIVEPSKRYLETLLIAELSAEPSRSSVDPDAAQAAFAAAALAEIDRASGSSDPNDLRLLAATRLASSRLSERSALPAGAPFDVSGKGYRLPPQSAETIRAICDIFRYSASDCEPETARRLVRYFLETRADRPGEERGWRSDTGTKEGKAAVWATALALLALLDLRGMLDQQINHRILGHFTVRKPDDINLKLTQLFLPDAVSALKDIERSIGVQLQAMRAHVAGTTSAGDNYSLVLYGPPGTGKTTLIEALARSSSSTLVEITPSDILIGGSEQIERHTRLVFSALAMLSQCIILFDEFDSILRKRTRGAPLNQFQFLTPGLLPKLKRLHDRAEKQRLAYALATNFIGDLDRAAIRSGRFDRRIGIFPPDLLSRVGRLTVEMREFYSGKPIVQHVRRAINIINSSAGYGMATLGKPRWFTQPRPHANLNGTPFGHIFKRELTMPDFGEPEGKIDSEPNEKKREKDPLGAREWDQWNALIELDKSGKMIGEGMISAKINAGDWKTYVRRISTLVDASAE
jgi:ATPase family associated with various cellular activities (AAA)